MRLFQANFVEGMRRKAWLPLIIMQLLKDDVFECASGFFCLSAPEIRMFDSHHYILLR